MQLSLPHLTDSVSVRDSIGGLQKTLVMCADRFSGLSNGRPDSELDLACILLLGMHAASRISVDPDSAGKNPVGVAALVKMGALGLGTLRAPEDRLAELAASIETRLVKVGNTPVRHTEGVENVRHAESVGDVEDARRTATKGDAWGRCASLWNDIVAQRSGMASRIESMRTEIAPLLPDGLQLLDHQLEALVFLRDHHYRAILADDMGLGKTIEALAALMLSDSFPALIVCPLSVRYKWVVESRQWLARHDVHVVELTDDDLSETELLDLRRRQRVLIVCSYERLVSSCKNLCRLGSNVVVFDESQYLVTWTSQRTLAALRVRSGAAHRILLTGTLLPNGRYREAYAQLKVMDATAMDGFVPDPSSDWHDYAERFCGPSFAHRKGGKAVRVYNGRSDEVSFGSLLQRHLLRRMKTEVFGTDGLPPKTRYSIPVPLSDSDRVALAACKDRVKAVFTARAAALEEELLSSGVDPEIVSVRVARTLSANVVSELSAVRLAVGMIKGSWSPVRIRELLEEDHRVVVWCDRYDVADSVADRIRSKLGATVLLGKGDLSGSARASLLQAAEVDRKCDVLVLTRAFRIGIQLTSFDRAVFIERWWVPNDELQAEDRIHRMGQVNPVGVDFLVAPGTVDDAVGALQVWKEHGQSLAHGSIEDRTWRWLMVS